MRDDALIGLQLANFRIERLIGRGGMAQVYYGRDVVLERPVAIKVISSRYRDEPEYTQRFIREARSIARWQHPNVIQVYYAGQEDGLYFLVMEYVPGSDLRSVLDDLKAEERYMAHEEVLRIGRGVAAALDFAHQNGVIHRDIKPGNVLLADDGRVVLTDFGLALDTTEGSSGEAFGSPRYIAPEQARSSRDVVPQSDLYSLGVMLYEMFTGRVPFDDPSATSLAVQHLTEPPPLPRQFNPQLNEATEAVLLRALAKKPHERYQSGRALLDALQHALMGNGSNGRDPQRDTDPKVPSVLRQPASLQERVARETQHRPVLPPIDYLPHEPVPLPAASSPPRRTWLYLTGAGLLLLLCLVLGAAAALTARNLGLGRTPTMTPGEETVAAGDPNGLPDGEATDGAGQEQPGTPDAPTATLPAAVPNLLLIYNQASFYVWNTGNQTLALRDLRFEAVDGGGNPAGFSLDGGRWSAFYPWLEPGNCASLEVLGIAGRLRPNRCQGYNAILTPEAEDDTIFWWSRPGVDGFRVLLQGAEIGRCSLSADNPEDVAECQVGLP